MEQVKKIEVSLLSEFKNHPFRVNKDVEFYELERSIENDGILVPLLVRPSPYGAGYELISGHRRKAACEELGIKEVPVIIREMSNDQAIIAMVDSNLQRETIKPSEKAFAYKMKLDAMNRQRYRTDLSSGQLGQKNENNTVVVHKLEITKVSATTWRKGRLDTRYVTKGYITVRLSNTKKNVYIRIYIYD